MGAKQVCLGPSSMLIFWKVFLHIPCAKMIYYTYSLPYLTLASNLLPTLYQNFDPKKIPNFSQIPKIIPATSLKTKGMAS